MKVINPASLGRPTGYANGVLTPPGVRVLFVAGQIGWDEQQRLVGEDFVEQFDRALRNVLEVVREAGGAPGSIGRMTVYVTDKREYGARRAEIGLRWRALVGRHYPAMTLVEVKGLLEDGAKVEIEATAVL
ncbi:MAG TPA: RidA family protein [Pyrinomonadaceae bacterium]|jgi:enamine deaminase RidA (YjgF/YER057c/UK114 family)|nr:RidA family protein [Pyrinomonadaceae bacterium]